MGDRLIGTDVNQVSITSLSRIRGQPQVVEHLQLHLSAHFNIAATTEGTRPPFGPVILCGPPGTGKTLVARAIHSEIGNLRFIETTGVTLNKKSELYSTLITADDETTILIDEAQGLNSEAQYVLLTALSARVVRVPGASSTYRYALPLAAFTMILATTHEYLLLEALRDRMRIHCRFDYYSVEDLVEIVRQRANALGWQYESDEVLQVIAQRAKAVPRQALHRNLQTCWEVARSQDRDVITMDDVREAFRHLQVDELGLDGMDRRYLAILAQHGSASLGALSAKLGLPSLTVQRVIEPYLIREDLITKDESSARIITDKGRRHVETTSWSLT